jgi:3-(3-hydroxy-phenyl)propionate hydroxylase
MEKLAHGQTDHQQQAESAGLPSFDCDVLVVGLGPTGDTLAALAKLHGLSVIAIDRERAVYPLPRAAVFDHEIMRIFQMVGVSERIAPLCRVPTRYQFLTSKREVLLDFPVEPTGPFGWSETYALHQPAVEQVLRDRLHELNVDVHYETEFDSITPEAGGVAVSMRSMTTGDLRTIRARYLVGCDGASSKVRTSLDITLSDYGFDEPWLVLDTIIDEASDLPLVCEQLCDPLRPATHLAMSGNRFRWEFMIKPGESPADFLHEHRIRELVAPWGVAERISIERKAVYRFHGLVANQWRSGAVFLAGDAAHQMPPFAGQGMCSGIRDAANLAWKLAAVIRGEAAESILESYQTEREPHVRTIIETAIAMGRIVCLLDPEAAASRDADMLARRRSGVQDVSVRYPDLKGGLLTDTACAGVLFPQPIASGARLDDILGRDAVLIGRDLPRIPSTVKLLDLAGPTVNPFRESLTAWLAASGAQAVLVRPDRHIFGIGAPLDLLDRWKAALTQLPQQDLHPTPGIRAC